MNPAWLDGTHAELSVSLPGIGPVLVQPLPLLPLMTKLTDGEVIRFTYSRTDPETGVTTHGAARLILEEVEH